ncbi:unnamed protein product [Phytophthora lilii]|uniref:Unnamed protein product n=1 Tax=Phytophthora lilii TaxID=2077276 RepID=A0A9W6X058_9STRA|nr:unnamed protein product [Phytophthora lilii]
MPREDSASGRAYGVLLGIVQDFVVISLLVLVLWSFDAVINGSSCCNDTAPNGCLDCFTRGIPFLSRAKLVFKRLLRFSFIYSACLLSVTLFAMDVVTVRAYRRRYEFGWDSGSEELIVAHAVEKMTIKHVLVGVLISQGCIALATTVWFDMTRWTPLKFASIWQSRRTLEIPTVITSRPSVNYLVMNPDEFFDSSDNENLSEFFDSNNRPIRGTQPPQPRAILSDDTRDLPISRWKFCILGLFLGGTVFIVIPLLLLLITSYCSPVVASIALNSNVNEPLRAITTLSFVRPS